MIKPQSVRNYYCVHSGMTMVELLAAVCILTILIIISTAGLKSMYKKVEAVQCVNNLRQIGMAIQLYLDDNSFILPPPGRTAGATWARLLVDEEYIDEHRTGLFACPSMPASRAYRINSGHKDTSTWEHADYGEGDPMDVSTLLKPAETLLLSEYQNLAMDTDIDSNLKESFSDDTMWAGNYPDSPDDALLEVHSGGSNYLFVDMRVEWLSSEDMKNDPNDYVLYEKP